MQIGWQVGIFHILPDEVSEKDLLLDEFLEVGLLDVISVDKSVNLLDDQELP